MRLAVLMSLALSALVHAQQVAIRGDDGRFVMAARLLNPTDVPPTSALHGISVVDAQDGKSVVVSATSEPSLLHTGDQVDEIQLPGIKDRERTVNPSYWPYQVWTASDFYRLAAKCVEVCLVRLRSADNLPESRYSNAPRVFGYLPVGAGQGFGVELDEANGTATRYVDLRTGERFSPPALAR